MADLLGKCQQGETENIGNMKSASRKHKSKSVMRENVLGGFMEKQEHLNKGSKEKRLKGSEETSHG